MELSKEQILAASDIPAPEQVEVPEWGGHVYVRVMSGTERDAFEQSCIERRGKRYEQNLANIRAKLVSRTLCNAKGEQMNFSPAEVRKLGEKSAAALDRVFAVAQKINGLKDEDVEELAGN